MIWDIPLCLQYKDQTSGKSVLFKNSVQSLDHGLIITPKHAATLENRVICFINKSKVGLTIFVILEK